MRRHPRGRLGNPISFTMVTNEGNSVRTEITGIIHEGMAAIGLDVDFQIVEFSTMVAQLTGTYDWEALVVGLTGSPDPFGGMNVWHSGEDLHSGIRISLSPPRSGRPRSTSSTSPAAES